MVEVVAYADHLVAGFAAVVVVVVILSDVVADDYYINVSDVAAYAGILTAFHVDAQYLCNNLRIDDLAILFI